MPQEAECVIFDYGEISRFELDAFYPKEPVCEPGAFLVEEASVHSLAARPSHAQNQSLDQGHVAAARGELSKVMKS